MAGTPSTTVSVAECETGNLVLGGGYELTGTPATADVVSINRATSDEAWTAKVEGGTAEITAYAICSTP